MVIECGISGILPDPRHRGGVSIDVRQSEELFKCDILRKVSTVQLSVA